jgi:hypothetical protein
MVLRTQSIMVWINSSNIDITSDDGGVAYMAKDAVDCGGRGLPDDVAMPWFLAHSDGMRELDEFRKVLGPIANDYTYAQLLQMRAEMRHGGPPS